MCKCSLIKFNNHRAIALHRLPFIKTSPAGVNFWNIPAAGGFAGGCQTGEALAKIYLRYLREDRESGGGSLQLIVADMCLSSGKNHQFNEYAAESLNGQMVGFLSVLDKWLRIAVMSNGDRLDDLDITALLRTANAGICAEPKVRGHHA
ncbi:hypothetical protein [Salmonella enterica]|uniref:hypothetical protein n=1 Tax=Salmonella enterica TaxID=28901 RepID=UPI0033160C34